MALYQLLLTFQVVSSFFLLADSFTPDIVKGMLSVQPLPSFGDQEYEMSAACVRGIENMFNNSDTVMAVDAIGKPGAGFLVGNINMLGHFDECGSLEDFHYCLVFLNITIKTTAANSAFGICAPVECNEYDILLGFEKFIETGGNGGVINLLMEREIFTQKLCLRTSESSIVYQVPPSPFDWKFALTVTFFSLLFLLVVLSSLYHAWYHSQACRSVQYAPLDEQGILHQNENNSPEQVLPDAIGSITSGPSQGTGLTTFHKIIFSFALPHNLPKLLSGTVTNDSIPCIHGVRVISMLWVILGHVFVFILPTSLMNPLTAISWLSRYGFLAVSNAFFSVDSFFFLSGLLVTYLTLKQMRKKQGRIPWHWFYFHRYWRLTPALAVTMLFYVYIVPYFGDGPYAQVFAARPNCPKYWWANLLYINNFYPSSVEMCIGWVWYLANDMQFFIISPIILVPLYFIPWIGLSLIAVLCAISILITGILGGIHNFPPGSSGLFVPPTDDHANFVEVIYYKPYCRIAPYLVGMIVGYVFYKYPKKSVKIHWIVALISWVCACGLGYACIYSIYPNINGHPWSAVGNGFYQGLVRCAWGIFLAWVVFACHYGYGGWVNSFLGHPAWAPFGRLTYTAYLLHPIVLTIFTCK
ncbi:putative nose resistant to fluoxetine protein 6 [Apostichopus japonicus]|uniref:Putative nose resistant to fluoxetine protein 6 n=1 Tax=Stichopus japonicus TaxID=307972 RepID=A0A2G8K6V3_STIJA|nr:putative nose resistant to fluoxetine protein 6 [Apostichopus japonicus]